MAQYGQPDYYNRRIKGLFSVLIKYWTVLVVFAIVSIAVGQAGYMPGSMSKFLITAMTVGSAYNGAWWYMFVYVVLCICSPIILKAIKNVHPVVILAIGLEIYSVALYMGDDYNGETEMEKQEIILSVIVPIYNGALHVSKLIESILEKNCLKDLGIEVILVDDGSIDNSEEVCIKYCQVEKNIIYTKKMNGGIASARNHGLNLARGKYISFADQDDVIIGGGYQPYIQQCFENNLDILYTSPYHIDEKNGTLQQRVFEELFIDEIPLIRAMAGKLIDSKYLSNEKAPAISTSVWNVLYRKEMLNNSGISFKSFIDYEDDWIFNIEALLVARRVAICSSGYYCWVIRSTSESHRNKYIPELLNKRKNWMAWVIDVVPKLCNEEHKVDAFIENVLRPRNIMICFNNACWKPKANRNEIIDEINQALDSVSGWDISGISVMQAEEMNLKNKFLLLLLKLGLIKLAYFLNINVLKNRFH